MRKHPFLIGKWKLTFEKEGWHLFRYHETPEDEVSMIINVVIGGPENERHVDYMPDGIGSHRMQYGKPIAKGMVIHIDIEKGIA